MYRHSRYYVSRRPGGASCTCCLMYLALFSCVGLMIIGGYIGR